MMLVSLLCCLGTVGVTPEPISVNPATLEVFQPLRVAVEPGQPLELDLPARAQGANYLVVLGSLADRPRPAELLVELAPTERALPVVVADPRPDPQWLRQVQAQRRKMQQTRKWSSRQRGQEYHAARFSQTRGFHLFVKDGSFRDRDCYQEVTAELVAVGKHCLIYVDRDDHPETFSRTLVDDVVKTFDEHVLPLAERHFGKHEDVDRDGKFTILFTHWLSDLSNGTISVGGFVRGGDFYRDVEPPFSNQCDMMYLNSNLKPGEHTRTLIAHEYTHAVTFSEHVFGEYLANESGQDEEAWLNEAISHLAENLIGSGWSNLDYRISTFLTAPASYRLVVEDYYRAGLWRCHGSRGATYLFLRWCVDQYGIEILGELTRSSLRGRANLEAATETPFAELFRNWTVALSLDGIAPEAERWGGVGSLDLRGNLGLRHLAGAQAMLLHEGTEVVTLAPTSAQPLRIHVEPNQARRLRVDADADTALQVTLIRLPDDMPMVELRVLRAPPGQSPRAEARHLAGAPVSWKTVSWERFALPQTKAPDSVKAAETVAADEVFANPQSSAGSVLRSEPLELGQFRDTELVMKLTGIDRHGRRVAAWAKLTPMP